MPSISDVANENMRVELGLTVAQASALSGIDLMKRVRVDAGQTTWAFNAAQTDAVNYWRYLGSLSG